MSELRRALVDYLAIRRALGFKLKQPGVMLADFVDFLERAGAATVSTELALSWATQPAAAQPVWWSRRLLVVRGFATYLHTLDPATEVPPKDLLPGPSSRAIPYIFSDAEVRALMTAVKALRPPFRPAKYRTYGTLIGLLAVTGMRVGEAIGLDRTDVDLVDGLLTVRGSKFGKSREIPLHMTTVEALRAYARRRDHRHPRSSTAAFFVSTVDTRLMHCSVFSGFARLALIAGITGNSGSCRPRLHDLRHTFAVKTLLSWYRQGVDVETRLPLLSTYLGHANPGATYWYLTAIPELLALAAQRLERALGTLP